MRFVKKKMLAGSRRQPAASVSKREKRREFPTFTDDASLRQQTDPTTFG